MGEQDPSDELPPGLPLLDVDLILTSRHLKRNEKIRMKRKIYIGYFGSNYVKLFSDLLQACQLFS